MCGKGFPGGSVGKESACTAGDAGDAGLIPESGRSPGGGHSSPLQYACLENPVDRGDWQVTVQRVAESDTTEGLSTPTRMWNLKNDTYKLIYKTEINSQT